MDKGMKYIDADKLKKFEEALADIIISSQGLCTYEACKDVAKRESPILIDSLQQEQPEVDLEKDVESWFFNEISSKINVEHTMYYYFQECARRYFERGKNSK